MVKIGRPVNGITLNGLEYVLGNNQEPMQFNTEAEAKQFLLDNGAQPQELENYVFEEAL